MLTAQRMCTCRTSLHAWGMTPSVFQESVRLEITNASTTSKLVSKQHAVMRVMVNKPLKQAPCKWCAIWKGFNPSLHIHLKSTESRLVMFHMSIALVHRGMYLHTCMFNYMYDLQILQWTSAIHDLTEWAFYMVTVDLMEQTTYPAQKSM